MHILYYNQYTYPGLSASLSSKSTQASKQNSEEEVVEKRRRHIRGFSKQSDFTTAPKTHYISYEPAQIQEDVQLSQDLVHKLDTKKMIGDKYVAMIMIKMGRLNSQDPSKVTVAKEKIDVAIDEVLNPYVTKIRDENYGWKYGCGAKDCTKFFMLLNFRTNIFNLASMHTHKQRPKTMRFGRENHKV
ncbi:unnamed protein product [Vicia faba]|uniref:Uncharacterized protein n=1 Tax=Vicia faba TaxID=3906 RepID=A0AAV1AJE3_VICFA|nr:unnamed protein product [Vicia faba]